MESPAPHRGPRTNLLRRHLGEVLRAHREGQQRTLRDVSSSARVSLGYLSEIERGHKEASSELLAAVCRALGLRVSEVLREVADVLAPSETAPLSLETVQAGARLEPAPAEITPAQLPSAPAEITPAQLPSAPALGEITVSARRRRFAA